MWLTIIQKHWKNILIAIMAIIIAFSVNKCQKQSSDIDLLTQAKDSAFVVAKYYKDKEGKATFQVKTHEATIDQLKKYGEQLGLDNDKLRKQTGNLKRLVSYWQVEAFVNDSIMNQIPTDTIVRYRDKQEVAKAYHYDNGFMQLDQLYHPSDQTLSTLYSYKPSFQLTAYRKGQNIFKKGQLVTDVRFDDQNIQVREIKGIVIKEEKKQWHETRLARWGERVVIFFLGRVSK